VTESEDKMNLVMQAALETGQDEARTDELHSQTLITLHDDALTVYRMIGLDKEVVELGIKIACLKDGAEAAALVIEGWGANLPADHPLAKQVVSGRLGVRDLPDDVRYDMLCVFGETRDGLKGDWRCKIRKPAFAGADRTFAALEDLRAMPDWSEAHNRFRPFFVDPSWAARLARLTADFEQFLRGQRMAANRN